MIEGFITTEMIEAVKASVKIGDYMIVPVVSGSSAYPLEVGRVVFKSGYCFTVESLFNPDVRLAFQYQDILLTAERVYPESTGLNHSVLKFERINFEEALVARDYLRLEVGGRINGRV